MQSLWDSGATALTVSELVDLVLNGGQVPPRAVVITFDDGNRDVAEQAFPIMQEFGFRGTVYLIANALNASTNLSIDQLQPLIAAGWEIGSHSMTHADLVKSGRSLNTEICQSKTRLETALQVEIRSFAYPFGVATPYIENYVRDCGYASGAGLGTYNRHTIAGIYSFSRREVRGDMDLSAFNSLMPWSTAP